jgi:hypothetical protein
MGKSRAGWYSQVLEDMKMGQSLQAVTKEEYCMRTGETGDRSSTDWFKFEAMLEGDGAVSIGRSLHQEDIAILPERLTLCCP